MDPILTKEDFLLNVSEGDYEKGSIILSSGNNDIGRISVLEYRQLQRQSFKKPLPYLLQFLNLLRIALHFAARLALMVPAIYVYCSGVAVLSDVVELKALKTADMYSPPLIFLGIMLGAIVYCFEVMIRRNVPGFVNCFEAHFQRALTGRFPALKTLKKFGMRWMPSEQA